MESSTAIKVAAGLAVGAGAAYLAYRHLRAAAPADDASHGDAANGPLTKAIAAAKARQVDDARAAGVKLSREFCTCPHVGRDGAPATHRMAYNVYEPISASGATRANAVPVVAVHGLTRNSWDFHYLAMDLASKHGRTVYTVDVVGRGRSDWLDAAADSGTTTTGAGAASGGSAGAADGGAATPAPSEYNYGLYVSDLMTFLKLLHGAEGRVGDAVRAFGVHWVGTSMGGLIGMMIAAQPDGTPLRVPFVSLTLNDIGPFVTSTSLARLASYAGDVALFDDLEAAEAAFRARFAPFYPVTDDQWRELAVNSVQVVQTDSSTKLRPCYDAVGIAAGHKLVKGNTYKDVNIWPVFDAVRSGPLLLLRGGKSDILLGETADLMMSPKHAKGIDPAKRVLHVVPEAGHTPSLYDDERISRIAAFQNDAEP